MRQHRHVTTINATRARQDRAEEARLRNTRPQPGDGAAPGNTERGILRLLQRSARARARAGQ
ncbi:MAG: hypothetical protein DI534_11920 [Leifsonia xyli]|nr:MAG: hypothetical protein DI534_11920 [Leifsonia xyli]